VIHNATSSRMNFLIRNSTQLYWLDGGGGLKRQLKAVIAAILSLCGYRFVYKNGKYFVDKNLFFDEHKVYRKFFNKNEPLCIFDVGGHIGQSIAEFVKWFPNSEVHSFEPISDNFRQIQRRFGNNKRIIINQLAVSNTSKEMEINIVGENATGNSAFKPAGDVPFSVEKVSCTTIDEYVAAKRISKIHILKIDTQGYEKECLEGARATLTKAQIRMIKIEIMLHDYYQRQSSFRMLEEILHQYGYRLFDICMIKKSSIEARTLLLDAIYVPEKEFQILSHH
jgi:FkbM family methyltransferase